VWSVPVLDNVFGVCQTVRVGLVGADADAADWPGMSLVPGVMRTMAAGLKSGGPGRGVLASMVPSGSGGRSRCLLASPDQIVRHDSPDTSST
jgi:hypothetical protein